MLRQIIYTLLCFTFTINASALDINVSEVKDIQNAINQVSAAGGGTVQLAAGTYIISASIKMKSNVTFQGTGNSTRIELPLNATYPMIIDDGTEPCRNMTIRNMLLDGNIPESKVSHDSEYTTDPQNPCLGILIDASHEATYHTNVIIENMEIHNTVDACHLKGVRGGYIDNVYFHHNGIFFWPGHNAYLRRCIDYKVTNSRFEKSYNGSGVNCSWSKNLLFSHCEVIESEGRGIRNAASQGFVVHDCVIVDCGDAGIIANTEGGVATSGVDFRRNCVSGCKTGITGGTSGVAHDNNAFGNGSNYSLGSSVVTSGNTSNSSQSCSEEIGAWNPIRVSAQVANENAKQVIVEVSANMAKNNTYEGFTVKVDGALVTIDSISMLNPTKLIITLSENISADNNVTLSYSESGNVQTELGTALAGFQFMTVDNVAGLPIAVETASLNTGGTFVSLNLTMPIGTIHDQSDNFTFNINDELITTERTVVDGSVMKIYPSSKIYKGNVVTISYTPGAYSSIVGLNKSELEAFSNMSLENVSTLTLLAVPGKIEAEDYDAHNGIQLETCGEGGQNVAYIDTDDWVEYNVQVVTDTTYKVTFRSAARAAGGKINVYVDGSQKGVVTVPNTGAWQTYKSTSIDMKLTSGAHTVKLVFTESFNVNWMNFEETAPGNEADSYHRIEAETFDGNSGTSIETCSDTGGGEDVGSIRNGNWLKFSDVDLSNVVEVDMRLATNRSGSSVQVRLGSTTGTLIASIDFPNTGGFQDWETTSVDVKRVEGKHDVYLVFKSSGSWVGNINWFQFLSSTRFTAVNQVELSSISLYPNPVNDMLTITNAMNSKVDLYTIDGVLLSSYSMTNNRQSFSTRQLDAGMYLLRVISNKGSVKTFKVIKQ